jgi:Api92-like protein with ferredoxin domain
MVARGSADSWILESMSRRKSKMANICENTITVIGLKEAPELFLKSLSKAMFQIDLDDLDPKQWGEDPSIDGKTWFRSLVEQHRQKGSYPLTYCILYPHKPYARLGLTAPRFHVDTKWGPPTDILIEASKVFPALLFDLSWWVEQDGPIGESVIKNGEVVEAMRRSASRYLFDSLEYPTASLLPAHMPYTLAQRGALRIEDAVDIIRDLRNILDDDRFRSSQSRPFSECRDKRKTAKLQAGLATLHESMVEQARQLGFDGVFLEEQELREKYPAAVEADKILMETLSDLEQDVSPHPRSAIHDVQPKDLENYDELDRHDNDSVE